MCDRKKLEGQKPRPPQATNVIKRGLAGLATKGAHWDFSLRSNSNEKKFISLFWSVLILLACFLLEKGGPGRKRIWVFRLLEEYLESQAVWGGHGEEDPDTGKSGG